MIGVAAGLAYFAAGTPAPSEAPPPSVAAPVVGAPAPSFDLETPGGQRVRLADLRGKVAVLNFWATWCAPCRLEMPDLEARAVADPDRLAVVGINFDESAAEVEAFRKEVGVTFPLVLDPGGKVQRLYRVLGYPTTFFLDEEGIIRIQHIGLMSASQIDEYLEEMGLEP